MPGRACALNTLATGALAMVVLTGCYAKSVPIAPLEIAAPSSESPATQATLLAGVRGGEHGENIERLLPERIVQRFAERLAETRAFSEVVYPLTDQSPAVPDVVFEISVSSSYDLHPVSNLAKDVAVGLSILLLQPVLPTVYELEVQLATNAPMMGAENESALLGSGRSRFEFTWLQAPEESVRDWHRGTTDRAVDELVNRIARRYGADLPTRIPEL